MSAYSLHKVLSPRGPLKKGQYIKGRISEQMNMDPFISLTWTTPVSRGWPRVNIYCSTLEDGKCIFERDSALKGVFSALSSSSVRSEERVVDNKGQKEEPEKKFAAIWDGNKL